LAIGISIYDSLLSMFEQQEAVGNLVTLEYPILDGIFNLLFGSQEKEEA